MLQDRHDSLNSVSEDPAEYRSRSGKAMLDINCTVEKIYSGMAASCPLLSTCRRSLQLARELSRYYQMAGKPAETERNSEYGSASFEDGVDSE